MSAAEKRGSGASAATSPAPVNNLDAAADTEDAMESPAYVVARGRTVSIEGKSVGPGSPVDLSAEDAEWLLGRGFIVDTSAVSIGAGGVSVGGLRIHGGRKPGGVVPR